MTEKLMESMSAFIDGEASEIEVHRLLRQLPADGHAREAILKQQWVRSAARGEEKFSEHDHSQLFTRVQADVVNEPFDESVQPTLQPLPRSGDRRYWGAGLAVAATIAVAVVAASVLLPRDGESANVAAAVAPGPVSAQPAALASDPSVSGDRDRRSDALLASEPGDGLRQLDEKRRQEVEAFLQRNEPNGRNARDENSRVVTFDDDR